VAACRARAGRKVGRESMATWMELQEADFGAALSMRFGQLFSGSQHETTDDAHFESSRESRLVSF
jgi:hypothetical protein